MKSKTYPLIVQQKGKLKKFVYNIFRLLEGKNNNLMGNMNG